MRNIYKLIRVVLLFVFFMLMNGRAFAGISFVGSTLSGQEDSGVISVQVDLQGVDFNNPSLPVDQVQFDYSISGGSAIANVDYISTSGTLTWTAVGSQPINISIVSDSVVASNETFSVTLSNCQALAEVSPCGQALSLSLGPSIVTIINDDFPGTLSLSSSTASATEGSATTFSVMRTGGSDGTVSVDYATANGSATAGSDYTSSSGTLTWANGDSASKTFTVTALADVVVDADETFTVNLSNASGGASLGTSSAITTISDATVPGTLSLSSSTVSTTEGSTTSFLVTRTGGSDGVVSIDYATSNGTAIAGSDYTSSSGTLTWANGDATSKTITVSTTTDLVVDGNEIFTLTLSNVQGSASLGTVSTTTITIANTTLLLTDIEGLTPQQQAVASTVNGICTSASGDLELRCQEILNSGLSDEQLIEVIDSIIPKQVSAQGSVAIDFGFQQLKMVHGRIVSLRRGQGQGQKKKQGNKNRVSLSGFTMKSFGQNIPVGKIAQSLITNSLGGGAGDDETLHDNPLGIFLTGQIDIGDKDSTGAETGFDVDSKSITLGVDYQFTDQLVMGIASGYGHTNTEFNSNAGDMESHSGNFSVYGSYFLPQDFYIDGILSYSINDYDSSRTISYTGFNTSAKSTPFGDQYGGSLGFGKDFYVKSFFFSPYARVEYLRTGIDKYSEKGGKGLALRIAEQSVFSLASTLGGQMNYAYSAPWGIISPGMSFEWRHQFRDDQRNIHAQFIDASSGTGSFSIATDDPDRDYFNLGASLAITLPEGRSAFIRYESRLGQDDITNHTIEAAIRMPF